MVAHKTTIRLSPELTKTFQEEVSEEAGKLRGAQNESFNEAVLLWLGYKGRKQVVSVATAEGSEPIALERVESSLSNFLKEGWSELKGMTIRALFTRIKPSDTVSILRPFKKMNLKEIKYTSKFGEVVKLSNINEISNLTETEEGTFALKFDAGAGKEYQLFASESQIDLQCVREAVPFF
ncbi:MAG: hypothetical protein ACYCQJ_02660 [Nitrososphaerales archaeon]